MSENTQNRHSDDSPETDSEVKAPDKNGMDAVKFMADAAPEGDGQMFGDNADADVANLSDQVIVELGARGQVSGDRGSAEHTNDDQEVDSVSDQPAERRVGPSHRRTRLRATPEKPVLARRNKRNSKNKLIENVFFMPGSKNYSQVEPDETFATAQDAWEAGFYPRGDWDAQGLSYDQETGVVSYKETGEPTRAERPADASDESSVSLPGVDGIVSVERNMFGAPSAPDESHYAKFIQVPESRPTTVNDLSSEQMGSLVQRLTPSGSDLVSLADPTIRVEPVGVASMSSKQQGQANLDAMRYFMEGQLNRLASYQVAPEVVRQAIMDGKIPSLSTMLMAKNAAVVLRQDAITAIREAEIEYTRARDEWLREQVALLIRKYEQENAPYDDETRQQYFDEVERQARELERRAEVEILDQARRELEAVVVNSSDDEAMRALAYFVRARERAEDMAREAAQLDMSQHPALESSRAERDDLAAPVPVPVPGAQDGDDLSSSVEDDLDSRGADDAGVEGEGPHVVDDEDELSRRLSGMGSSEDDEDAESEPEITDSFRSELLSSHDDDSSDDDDASDDMFAVVDDKPSDATTKRGAKRRVKRQAREATGGKSIDSSVKKAPSRLSRFLSRNDKNISEQDGSAKKAVGDKSTNGSTATHQDDAAMKFIKEHKVPVIVGGSLAALLLAGGAVFGISAALGGGDDHAQDAAASASASQSTHEIQSKFHKGDKMRVVIDGNVVPVTIASFDDKGAVATDNSGKQYMITNDQLQDWVNNHPNDFK